MSYRFRQKDLHVTRSQTGGVLYYLIEDPTSGVRHRLYEMEYEAARLLDGRRGNDKVARLVSRRMGLQLQGEDVDRYARQLMALGFVEET